MFWVGDVPIVTLPNASDVGLQCGTAVCVCQVTVVAAGATVAPAGVNDWLMPMPGTFVAADTTMLQLAPTAMLAQLLLCTLSGADRLGEPRFMGRLPSLR